MKKEHFLILILPFYSIDELVWISFRVEYIERVIFPKFAINGINY